MALAARVEAAQGADRELDALIYDASGHFAWWDAMDGPKRTPDRNEALRKITLASRFEPTASLDAAVSLVPEGWEWAAGIDPPGYFREGCAGWARVFPRSRQDQGTGNRYAATPALALTAAALRDIAQEIADACD